MVCMPPVIMESSECTVGSSTNAVELIMKPGKTKSAVWSYFCFVPDN